MAGLALAVLVSACAAGDRIARQEAEQPRLHFVAFGDSRPHSEATLKLVPMMAAEKPDLIIHTGDIVSKGTEADQWDEFFSKQIPLFQGIPFFPSRGNHDLGGIFEQRFPIPDGSGSKVYYSFDRANCHFVAIDSNLSCKPGSPMRTWLEQDLRSTKADHVFCFWHHPPKTINPTRSDNEAVIQDVMALMNRYKVTAVFCGHDHHYHRMLFENVPLVVTGGGGASLYDIDPKKRQPGDVADKCYHYVDIYVNGPVVEGAMIRLDGSVGDRFTWTKKPKVTAFRQGAAPGRAGAGS